MKLHRALPAALVLLAAAACATPTQVAPERGAEAEPLLKQHVDNPAQAPMKP